MQQPVPVPALLHLRSPEPPTKAAHLLRPCAAAFYQSNSPGKAPCRRPWIDRSPPMPLSSTSPLAFDPIMPPPGAAPHAAALVPPAGAAANPPWSLLRLGCHALTIAITHAASHSSSPVTGRVLRTPPSSVSKLPTVKIAGVVKAGHLLSSPILATDRISPPLRRPALSLLFFLLHGQNPHHASTKPPAISLHLMADHPSKSLPPSSPLPAEAASYCTAPSLHLFLLLRSEPHGRRLLSPLFTSIPRHHGLVFLHGHAFMAAEPSTSISPHSRGLPPVTVQATARSGHPLKCKADPAIQEI